MNSQPKQSVPNLPAGQAPEGPLVRRARDLAGVASVIGFGLLVGYAFTNLRPGWQWTIEDYQRAMDGQSDDS
ncbi:MAG: hypothetical protein A2201_11955 [Alicyclobacillus sp. RIFOXYA1_FULL_53_8]|nr:MAG: hypothetical protein A2201_11955 [Alicyclobacillus sp. RIFOXYA1_FULL_53_8]